MQKALNVWDDGELSEDDLTAIKKELEEQL